MDEKKHLIELINLSKIYRMGDNEVRANDGLNLTIDEGEFVAIVGKSGSGKSTLMNIIGALDVPTDGKYILSGYDVGEMSDNELAVIRNKTIGFIFQQYNLLPKLDVYENVELPLLYAGIGAQERKDRTLAALEKVGLSDKVHNRPNQLSGGQQQRVSIARALAGDPNLILADEPTGALDSKTSAEVLDFLCRLNEDGNTIVLITHDNSIALIAKRVVKMSDGKIVFDDTAEKYYEFINSANSDIKMFAGNSGFGKGMEADVLPEGLHMPEEIPLEETSGETALGVADTDEDNADN